MMTVSAASLCFDGFGDEDFRRTFELAPQVGFSAIEFNCWYPANITTRGLRSLADRCAASGLRASSLHFTGVEPDTDHKRVSESLAHKLRGVDMAAELGCDVLCTLGGPRRAPHSLDSMLTMLDGLLPAAEEAGVTVALENHAGHTIETPEDYRRILTRFDTKRLGVCADVGHFHAAGIEWEDVIRELGDRIVHVHVKDNAELGVKRFVPFGAGTAHNVEFVHAMDARGYVGDVVVELSPGSLDFNDAEGHMRALRDAYAMFSPFGTREVS